MFETELLEFIVVLFFLVAISIKISAGEVLIWVVRDAVSSLNLCINMIIPPLNNKSA